MGIRTLEWFWSLKIVSYRVKNCLRCLHDLHFTVALYTITPCPSPLLNSRTEADIKLDSFMYRPNWKDGQPKGPQKVMPDINSQPSSDFLAFKSCHVLCQISQVKLRRIKNKNKTTKNLNAIYSFMSCRVFSPLRLLLQLENRNTFNQFDWTLLLMHKYPTANWKTWFCSIFMSHQ